MTDTTTFAQRYGPWALVAGGSDGGGLAISHEAAARGLNVLILARDEERLARAAADVGGQHGMEVRTLAVDLADPALADHVATAVAGLEVGLLVHSASLALGGPFESIALEDRLRSIAVNCTAPMVLAHVLVPGMIERGRGGIGIVSSTAAIQGTFRMADYAPAKAFGWILAESLWTELGDHGIDVSTVLSGPIESPKFWTYQKTFDLTGARPDSPDPLERFRSRLLDPTDPRELAAALLDGLGDGPTHYAHALDEDISGVCFSATRTEAIALKRAYYETPRIQPA
jgi:short-subunit dehydrogenase